MTDSGRTEFESLRNITTGEVRNAALAADVKWRCSVTWCTGRSARESGLLIQRRNGTGGQILPAEPIVINQVPAMDRFTLVKLDERLLLYDLQTGRAGEIGLTWKDGQTSYGGIDHPASPIYLNETATGYLVVDLSAIK